MRIQIIIGALLVAALAIVGEMIRKKKVDLRYALPWIIVGIIMILLDIFPNLLERIAKLIGIQLPINMLFFFGFCFSLFILFIQTIAISRLSDKVKKLTQQIALTKHELEEKRMEEKEKLS